jgi:site-specific DNA-methyltransferase (adenine-specific)
VITKGLMSSNSNEWSTPDDLFTKLNDVYNFTLDPCSTHENAKCKKHYTKEENGLLQDWSKEIVFCNPPYGRELPLWVEKAYNENKKGAKIVMLIPARTDTRYFHNFIYNKHKIIFLKGRLKFGGSKNSAPFPSMLVIME